MTDLVKFKKNLTTLIDRKELALPTNVSPDAFKNAALVAVQNNPEIMKCTEQSLFVAIRELAGMGLVPDGRLAALVPFKGKAQATPMVAGLIQVVRNSGQVTSLWSDVIYEGETLEVFIEDGERQFAHVTASGDRINAMTRGGEIIGAYAAAKLKDGTVDFEAMGKEQIERRRMASPNQKDPNKPTGIWLQWYDEMARKTVIRALAKRLPMSPEDYNVIQRDPNFREIKDITPVEPKESNAERLARLAAEKREMDQSPEIEPEDESQEPLDGEVLDEAQKAELDAALAAAEAETAKRDAEQLEL